MPVANLVAYQITATITALQSFLVLAPEVNIIKPFYFATNKQGK
jgi:hypothetical protein